MASVLERIGKGVTAFGADTTSSNIDTIRANRDIAEQNVELGKQEIDRNQQAADIERQAQQLMGIISAGGPDADKAAKRLFQIRPETADEFFSGLGIVDQEGRERVSRRSFEIATAQTREAQDAIINRQINDLEADGLDASHTRSLLEMSDQDRASAIRFSQGAALSTKDRAAATGGGSSKLGQSVVTKDPETGELSFATPVLTGSQVETQQTPIGGEIVSRQLGETSEQRQERDVETAGGQVTARAVSQRDQDFINVGQRQADGTAIIRRGLQLLDIIPTGSPESVALAAKTLFGIAGADETELNANLGKAVLSQLRTTFGAQFTENEGKRLQALEASFGKSTAGNRRLLEQTLKSMERDARRGVDAAARNSDAFAVQEIQDALSFRLADDEPGKTQIGRFIVEEQ